MVDKERLVELAERCEAATGPDRLFDAEIYVALDGERENVDALAINGQVGSWVPEFTASLDAAMQLVPEGWDSSLHANVGEQSRARVYSSAGDSRWSYASTPALALCAAALRSLSTPSMKE
jgi:hypothetical protein